MEFYGGTFYADSSPLIAELFALRGAMVFMKDASFQNCLVESGSK